MDNDSSSLDTTPRASEMYGDREYRWFAFLLILVLVGVAGH